MKVINKSIRSVFKAKNALKIELKAQFNTQSTIQRDYNFAIDRTVKK
jgi:hypothetical protein